MTFQSSRASGRPKMNRINHVDLLTLPESMRIEDLAAGLRVSASQIRRWVADGQLPPPVKVDGRHRWTREAVVSWIGTRAVARSVMPKRIPKTWPVPDAGPKLFSGMNAKDAEKPLPTVMTTEQKSRKKALELQLRTMREGRPPNEDPEYDAWQELALLQELENAELVARVAHIEKHLVAFKPLQLETGEA